MKGAGTVSLLKEARNSIRLHHPNIVTVFDVGRINNEFYIAMEYLDGHTLQEKNVAARATRSRPTSSRTQAEPEVLLDVARGVHYAHTRPSPIIHCDLKPATILIDAEHGAHVLRLRPRPQPPQERSGGDGEITGTPSYMSPEQASGESSQIDAPHRRLGDRAPSSTSRSPGSRPSWASPSRSSHATIASARPSPKDVPPRDDADVPRDEIATSTLLQIPPFLEDLCMRCLTREQRQRPQTMQEVADILAQGLKAPHPERTR
jgi:serine/threonine protein kinase